jgi:haloalkane dehalogenase
VSDRAILDLPWGQVHVRSAGDRGAPLLLMLHQSPLSSRNYDAVLPLLAAEGKVRAVAVDTPGFGLSDPPAGDWPVEDYANAFWAIADRLSDGTQLNLFGRATGAVFAFAMACARPAAVRRLVLHGLPVYSAAEKADRLRAFAPPWTASADGSHLDWIWRRIQGEYPGLEPVLSTRFVADYLAAGPDFAAGYRAIWRYRLDPAALPEDLPVLLLGGSRDRIYFMHERAVRLLPRAEAFWLEGATDFVAEQDPELFTAALGGFLSR